MSLEIFVMLGDASIACRIVANRWTQLDLDHEPCSQDRLPQHNRLVDAEIHQHGTQAGSCEILSSDEAFG